MAGGIVPHVKNCCEPHVPTSEWAPWFCNTSKSNQLLEPASLALPKYRAPPGYAWLAVISAREQSYTPSTTASRPSRGSISAGASIGGIARSGYTASIFATASEYVLK